MSIIRIAHNAINAKIVDCKSDDIRTTISEYLSYTVESLNWSGKSTFFRWDTDSFPAGFVKMVNHKLTQMGHTVQVIGKPLPKPLGSKNVRVDNFPYDPNYSYQEETIDVLLRDGVTIAQIATGGGKSRVGKLAYSRIKRMTLFLTTRSTLMHQMKTDIENSMKITVGVIGNGKWDLNSGFNVAMVQSIAPYTKYQTVEVEIENYLVKRAASDKQKIEKLKTKLRKKKIKPKEVMNAVDELRNKLVLTHLTDKQVVELIEKKVKSHNQKTKSTLAILEQIEFVILEEAHESSADGFYNIMNKCKNAHYRLALTATPFMRENEEANMKLMACAGSVGIKISEKKLIDLGILAKPYFKYIQLRDRPTKVMNTSPWRTAYKYGIVHNQQRNNHILNEVIEAKCHGLTTMVLIYYAEHGHLLNKYFAENNLKSEFIYSVDDNDVRQAALNKLKDNEIDVLIGSTILDVGVDVPSVGKIIIAGGFKAEVGIRQRVGRGLRRKKTGKNVCYVVDFMDGFNTHLYKHSYMRESIIQKIPGFAENILPPNTNFNY